MAEVGEAARVGQRPLTGDPVAVVEERAIRACESARLKLRQRKQHLSAEAVAADRQSRRTPRLAELESAAVIHTSEPCFEPAVRLEASAAG